MTLKDYQQAILKFNICPDDRRLPHSLTGLTSELGELMGKFQKHFRGDGPLKTSEVAKELGDCLYYLADLSTTLGLDLQEIARANIEKLEDRKARNIIKGEGDNR